MGACGALVGRLRTLVDEPAVPAAPFHRGVPLEDPVPFDIFEQREVPFFVRRFRHGHHPEKLCDLREAFPVGDPGEIGIEASPLQMLACRRFPEVLRGRAYGAAREGSGDLQIAPFEEREEPFRVLLLIVRRVRENPGNLFVPLLLRLGREIGVPVPRLRFTGKRLEEILFRLRAFHCRHAHSPYPW